jgi:four helix bundle protein
LLTLSFDHIDRGRSIFFRRDKQLSSPLADTLPSLRRREEPVTTFDHERLDVYRAALDFVALVDELIERLPRGCAHLTDQLERAATSIVLNIAEGAGEFSRNDKARFYRMSRRSATESAAVLDIFRRRRIADEERLTVGRSLLLRIVSILTRMVRSLGEPGTGTGAGTGTEDRLE